MFSPIAMFTHKKQKTIVVRSQKFIKNQDEPVDTIASDTLNKDEIVLVEDSPRMRRRFRLIAQRIRIIHVYGVNKTFRD